MNKKEVEKLARENFTRIGQAIFEICNSYYWSDKKFKKRLKILMNLKKNSRN